MLPTAEQKLTPTVSRLLMLLMSLNHSETEKLQQLQGHRSASLTGAQSTCQRLIIQIFAFFLLLYWDHRRSRHRPVTAWTPQHADMPLSLSPRLGRLCVWGNCAVGASGSWSHMASSLRQINRAGSCSWPALHGPEEKNSYFSASIVVPV